MPTAPPVFRPPGQRDAARAYDRARGSAAKRGYGWKWRTKIQPAQLAREPRCRECLKEGVVTEATLADHIIPKPHGSDDPSNLQSLCVAHHAQKTARETRGTGG